ncbi:S8 family serine peptidase [Bacillus thuringiensis]
MKKSIYVFLSSIVVTSYMSSYSYAETIPTAKPFTGKGIKVAVIDSGVDSTHPDLQKNYLKGYDFIDNDTNPEDTSGHGTHVAGIIAADGAIKGIAPDAAILAYRVYDSSKGLSTETLIKAINQAIEDGAQIINISLQKTFNGADTPLNQAVQKAIDNNIVVITGAGNQGPAPWSIHSLASTADAITVGNTTQQGVTQTVFHIPDIQQDIEFRAILPNQQYLNPGEYSIVHLQKLDLDTIQKQQDLKNKIVVVDNINEEQDTDSIKELQKRGALVVLTCYENTEESMKAPIHLYNVDAPSNEFSIPLGFIFKTEKDMLTRAAREQKVVTIAQHTDAQIAFHSSQGPTVGSWQIKPDIAAPGVDIESTVPYNIDWNSFPDISSTKKGYALMTGTSMSAPYVAGAAALLKQAHPDWSPYEIRAALTGTTQLIKDMHGQIVSPLLQGSGKINIEKALKAEILPLTNNISFGFLHKNTGVKTIVKNLKIENVSNRSHTLAINNQLLKGKAEIQTPNYITIPAHQTIEVPVKLKVDTFFAMDKHIGMISLENSEEQIHIPYMVSVDPKDYPFISLSTEREVLSSQSSYLMEYYTPFLPEQLTISITGKTTDNQPFASVLMEKNNPPKGYQQFNWNGKDNNNNKIPQGDYKLVITAKYKGQSYQTSQPLTIY